MVTVTITQDQASSNRVDLSVFAGQNILISRRGTGFLTGSEFTNINTGGFSLTNEAGQLTAGETFFVWPASAHLFTSVQAGSGGVQQYPHIVKLFTSNWSTGDSGLSVYKGRAETGGNAKRGFNQVDESVICVVYMPLPIETIEIDTPVEVYWKEELIVSGPVKQFSRGQLNARIWL